MLFEAQNETFNGSFIISLYRSSSLLLYLSLSFSASSSSAKLHLWKSVSPAGAIKSELCEINSDPEPGYTPTPAPVCDKEEKNLFN